MNNKHIPRKRFGQNFLHDHSVIDRIVSAIHPKEGQNLVEIGPGLGALTLPLLKSLGHINVVELDRDIIPRLQQTLADYGGLTIHNVDALKFDFAQLDAGNGVRVAGNLPYNISTPLLFHLLSLRQHIIDMHFMLQHEVVARLAAEPGSKVYGKLSVITQYYCAVEYLFKVPPGAFNPPPKVDSAIVRLVPHNQAPVDVGDEAQFEKLVAQAFQQRRKTLRNNLKGMLSADEISTCDIDPGARAETLSLEDFARLSRRLCQHQSLS